MLLIYLAKTLRSQGPGEISAIEGLHRQQRDTEGRYPYLNRRSTGQQIPQRSGYRSSIPVLMRQKSKRLKTGRLSLRISTTAGPDMKSLSSPSTESSSLEGLPAGFIGAACLRSGGDIAFRALRDQHRAPEVQFAANSASSRPPRCCALVVPAFMSPEIGTEMSLTE